MVKGKQTPWCPESLCIHRVSGPWCPESLCIHISEHVKRLNTRTFQTQLDTQTPKPATLELFQTQLDNAKQAGGLRTTGAGTGTTSRTPSSSSTTAGRRSCVPGSSTDKDKENCWHYGKNCWDERQTEAHITVCSKVPDHNKRLWTPGARADDPWQQCGQGVEGSSTEGALAASSRERPG